jgi:hypothetical protein
VLKVKLLSVPKIPVQDASNRRLGFSPHVEYIPECFGTVILVSAVGIFACSRLKSKLFAVLQLLIYKGENKTCFSLELSHIQFINNSLHIVDLVHISCHDISVVITSLVTRKNTYLLQYYLCLALLLIIACVYRHLTVC